MSTPEEVQAQFNESLGNLNERLVQLETAPGPVAIAAPRHDPKACMPEKFDGKISKYRDFLASIKNYFVLQGARYPTEEIKIRFIGTLLTGDPLTWFRSLIEADAEVLTSMDLFLDEFKANYDDPFVRNHAQASLGRLRQAKSSVVTYAAKFQRIASDTGYNAEAKISVFRFGLNDDVKDVLASSLEEPVEFEAFVNYCIKIDNRLYERRLEKKTSGAVLVPHRNNFTRRESPAASSSATVPMDLDALQVTPGKSKKLSNDERTRRIKGNLCLYCGEAGHRIAGCPKKSKN